MVRKLELDMKETAALGLVTVGALNWGLVGTTGVNVVKALFGEGTLLSRLVYTAVGAAGAYTAYRAVQAARA